MAPKLTRRDALKSGIAAGSLFLPQPYAWVWAQSEGTVQLLKAPKVALVMGNSAYKDAPVLKNPANDAKAIGEALGAMKFNVTLKIDADRKAMLAAIRDYAQIVEATKCVGLFYFAGHGLQLAWHNYLLPVDASIDKAEEVGKQGVDVDSLMKRLAKAANPMNVVILDACRENPFGKNFRSRGKGLSQMDAPQRTLLAYATSPGNVASDGDGVNGLYTENLLKELKVQDAKIEEIFKRVRLGVRLKSNGAQIPWESTSLEEDFWFLPPAQLGKHTEKEIEGAFREELALWEKIRGAKDPRPFEDYLRRYPSGNFAELAQLQLDRALARRGEKRIAIASAEGNPFTKGSAFNRIANVGDTYTYREINMITKAERGTLTTVVTQVTDTEVVHNTGLVTDLLGNQLRSRQGYVYSQNQSVPNEFAIGKRWSTRINVTDPKGVMFQVEQETRVVTREPVTVPAGTFNAFLLEGRGRNMNPASPFEFVLKRWYVPEFQRPVVREQVNSRDNKVVYTERLELVSYKLA